MLKPASAMSAAGCTRCVVILQAALQLEAHQDAHDDFRHQTEAVARLYNL
jgi:hypothetical protein